MFVLLLDEQNEALFKMKTLSDIVKSGSQKITVEGLKSCISHESYLEPLSDLLSPLNPSIVLTEIWLVPDARTLYSTPIIYSLFTISEGFINYAFYGSQ